MAEGHQVRFTVVTALSQRLDVMHLLCLDEPAFPLASLTKRVCIHVSVTDAFPRPSIFSFDCRVPAVLPHIVGFLFFDAPHRTSHLSTWDSRGRNTAALVSLASAHLTFRAKGKPCRIAPARLFYILFRYCNDTIGRMCHTVPNRANFYSGTESAAGQSRVCGVPCEAIRSASGKSPPKYSRQDTDSEVPAAHPAFQVHRWLC